ncbi:hypothetical protein [Aquicella lusitana]|uniref:YD repeat-containing protein n=1 Tax=Aquicella lusitana TaxID=254246 RepID=A0A370GFW9_9COXI|nr:hypothetical protein [Aquicella lusitana]RDI42106.1 hypothetical protein C8D86_11660 [Aquicella lusitana]VVC74387.1 hypothetical protein AQULUS_21530 [Aquicella lusitana]
MTALNKNSLLLTMSALILYSTCTSTSVAANLANGNSSDPFIQEWDYFDGINTYKLNITKSSAPGQDYHIDYTFPGGRSATDMCKVTSNTTFTCITGETITRDDIAYSVKLTSSYNTYTFYDPNHMPPVSDIIGNWRWESSGAKYNIAIMRGASDIEYNVLTSYSDDRGNHCYYSQPDVYRAIKNPDGSEILSYGQYSFKYDPQKKQITNPKPRGVFYVGTCIALMDDGSIIFTKK